MSQDRRSAGSVLTDETHCGGWTAKRWMASRTCRVAPGAEVFMTR